MFHTDTTKQRSILNSLLSTGHKDINTNSLRLDAFGLDALLQEVPPDMIGDFIDTTLNIFISRMCKIDAALKIKMGQRLNVDFTQCDEGETLFIYEETKTELLLSLLKDYEKNTYEETRDKENQYRQLIENLYRYYEETLKEGTACHMGERFDSLIGKFEYAGDLEITHSFFIPVTESLFLRLLDS